MAISEQTRRDAFTATRRLGLDAIRLDCGDTVPHPETGVDCHVHSFQWRGDRRLALIVPKGLPPQMDWRNYRFIETICVLPAAAS